MWRYSVNTLIQIYNDFVRNFEQRKHSFKIVAKSNSLNQSVFVWIMKAVTVRNITSGTFVTTTIPVQRR